MFNPFKWVINKLDQRRINNWLALRQDGESSDVAIKKAWLSPNRAYRFLTGALNNNLGSVGILHMSRGKMSAASPPDQTTVLLVALVYLYPALPPDDQKVVLEWINSLVDHNWGYVRRAATEAISVLKTEGNLAPTI